jgi:hypothetical protein
MSADSSILNAGASKVRNGNRYNAATGARETALNPDGAAFPAMEVYSFQSEAALLAAMEGYVGNIVLHEGVGGPVHHFAASDDGPTDHFVQQRDRIVRCDRWGNPSAELEHLKPDHSGVIATGEVGPSAATPAAPAAPGSSVEFLRAEGYQVMSASKGGGPLQFLRGVAKWQTSGFGPGVTAKGTIVVPDGVPVGQVSISEFGTNKPGSLTTNVNGVEQQWGGGVATLELGPGSHDIAVTTTGGDVQMQTNFAQ